MTSLVNALNSVMVSGANILAPCDISPLEELLLNESGQLQPVPAEQLGEFSHNEIQSFCHKHGVYSLPTIDLVKFIECLIPDLGSCLEVGAGNGVYGRALGIPMTDNYMQHPKNARKFGEAALMYALSGQPVVNYGDDVQEIDGVDAVIKYKPETVLMSWVTHKYYRTAHERSGNMYGVDMMKLAKRKHVKRIILIGNDAVHGKSPLMELPHQVLRVKNALFSRASQPQGDAIYVWDIN